QDIQLIVSYCDAPWQDCAYGVPRPVVCTGEGGRSVSDWIVEEHAGCGCGLPGSGATHTINIGSACDGEHATRHIVHRVVGQGYTHLGPSVGGGGVAEQMLEDRACHI